MKAIKKRLRGYSDWLGLIDALEQEIDQLSDRQEKSRQLYALGRACEEIFLRKDRAMVNYQKAFKAFRPDVRPIARARAIYHEMGNLKMVAKLLDFQLKVVNQPDERAELLGELATTQIDLYQAEAAKQRLTEASQLGVESAVVADALQTLNYDQQNWLEQINAFVDRAAAAEQPEQAAQLLVRAARLYGLEAPDDDTREELLRKATEFAPEDRVANFLLEALLVERGRVAEIVALHEGRLAQARPATRGSLARTFASQWAIRFVDHAVMARFYTQALNAFYSGESDDFPGHVAAVALLREVAPERGGGAALLELADKGLSASLPEDDICLLAGLAAEIASRDLGDLERAATYVAQAAEVDPEAAVVVAFRKEHGQLLKEEPELNQEPEVAAYSQDQPTEVVSQERIRDMVDAAEFAAAESVDEAVTGGDPEEPPAVDEDGRSERLDRPTSESLATEASEEHVASDAPASAADISGQDDEAGEAAAEEGGELVMGAEEDSEASVITAPADSPTDGAAESAAEAPDADEQAAAAVEEFAHERPTAGAAELPEEVTTAAPSTGQQAAALGATLPEVDESVDEATALLFAEARKAAAQSPERGIEAWRRVAQKARDLRTPRRALIELYSQVERWNALVEVLKEEIDATEDAGDKSALMWQLVAVYRDRLRLDVMVVNVLSQILKLQPDDTAVLDQLAAHYEKMSRWSDLITTLRKKAEATVEPDQAVQIWSRVAALFLERFSNQAEAIKAYERVLELDPRSTHAIAELKAMYERRRDWDKLIQLSQREIELVEDSSERTEKLLQVAKLASTKLKRPQVSMDLWRQVADHNPDNLEAWTELERLYERAKDWESLAQACQRQIDLSDDANRRLQLLQKLGVLFSDKAKDDSRAVEAWRALLELDPDNRRAQDSLKKLYLASRAYDELEAFYSAQNKWDEFIRVLERQVDSEDTETRMQLNFKIADLWQTKMGKPERAIRAYEKVLALDERNLQAAEALIPLYEGGRDVGKYANALQIQLEYTEDEDTRLERTCFLAELSEQKLRDKEAAFAWYVRALELNCLTGTVRQEAERLAAEVGRWADLVSAYEQGSDRVADPAEALPLMATVARVYEEELGDTEQALQSNQRILELQPQDVRAIEALERLYTKTEQWGELLQIYQRKIELVDEVDARRANYFRIAQLYEHQLEDPQQAIDAYQTVLDLAGDDVQALEALSDIYQRQQRWLELAETLLRQLPLAEQAGQADLVALKFRLGVLRESQLDDPAGAVECYRDILSIDPRHQEARDAIERQLASQDNRAIVAEILEPIYREIGEWNKLIQIQEIQLEQQDDPLAKVELLLGIGQLWADKLGDGAQAFDAYARCFRVDPTNEIARAELENLAAIQERWEELAALYEQSTEHALDAALQHQLLVKLAEVSDNRLEQRERAAEFYRRASELQPDDSETLDALERIYTDLQRWTDLLQVLRSKVELAKDADTRRQLLSRMAMIWEDMVGDVQEATNCYNEILAHDEQNIEALRALDRLYQAQSAWHELADNLSRQLELAEGAEAVELLVRLARLRETELEEIAAAVDTYRQVLERESGHPDAIESLQRLISHEEQQLSIAQLLEPHYAATNDWAKLIEIYEIMVRHAFEPSRKVELLHRVGELYEVSGEDPGSAFEAYGRALREDPSSSISQGRLETLARQLDGWQILVDLYTGLIPDVLDESLVVALHGKVAQIWDVNLQRSDEAAAAYRRILEIEPQNLEAVEALEQLYLRCEAHQQLVEILTLKAEIVLDSDARKELLFRAAQIYDSVLEQPEQAVRMYQQVLELDDRDSVAIAALEVAFQRMERWEDLREIYQRKAELAENPADKKSIFYALGALYEQSIGDSERAIEAFQSVLDLDAEDATAIEALDRLYREGGRWYDLLQNLERQIELAGQSASAVELKYRLGALWQGELGDLTRAIETYRDVLALDPNHQASIDALDGLVRGEGEPVLAAQVLEPVYEQALQWPKLVGLYEVMVAHLEDPPRRVELLQKIAAIQESHLEDSGQAFGAHSRALREEGNEDPDASLEQLERLADGIEEGWSKVAQLYESELDRLLDAERQVAMGLRLARVYEVQLGQPAQAVENYRRILEIEPDDRTAIASLDRLYEGAGQWAELADVLRQQIRMATDDQQATELRFRLAQLYQQQLDDIPNAVEVYRDILTSSPDHGPTATALELLLDDGRQQAEIAEILEPLYRSSEQWEKLVKIMQVQLETMDDQGDRVQAIQRIAETCEQRLGDHMRAFQWWGYALSQEPTAEMITEELERLARMVDGWQELVGFYSAVLDDVDVEERKRLLKMAARVQDEELRDAARAEETYLKVLQCDDVDPDALAALDRIYDEGAMHGELAEILKRRIAITDETDVLVELQLRLAAGCERDLADAEQAIAVYRQVLDSDSRNARALDALEQIYFRRREWQDLHDVYESMIDIAPGDAGIADCYARMAKISSDALGDSERAQDLWNRVLDLRGEDPVALWALADLYESAGEWRELVEVLQRQVSITEDPQGQVRLFTRLGRIWGSELGRERNALENWQRVLEIEPANVDALSAIAAIYRETQAWEELAETLNRLIELGITGDLPESQLADLYAQLGELHGEILLRPEEAVAAWGKVLELTPGDLRALVALEALLMQQARWEECIGVLEQRAAVLEEPAEKIDVLIQVASLWQDKVGDTTAAARVYERLLQLDLANQGAVTALRAIYEESGSWEPLIELLLSRIELADTAESSVELLQQVARIYEEQLGQPDQAFVVLQAAFKRDYTNDVTASELERLASTANRWNELLTEYNTVVQSIADPQVKADLLVKMGRWYGNELGHLEYGITAVQQALQIMPDSVAAMEVLAGFLRQSARWPELAEVLRQHVELEDDPPRRVELLHALAEVYEAQLEDPARSIAAYRQTLEIDQSDEYAITALDRLYRAHQEWGALIDVLQRKSELTDDPDQVISIKAQIGALYRDHLDQPARSVESYKDILTIDPQNLLALKALEGLYEQTGQVEDYLDVLEQQLDVSGSDEERMRLYHRMAVVWEEQFGKLDRATECLEKILLIDASHESTYRELERLYRQDSRFDDLVDVLQRHINATSDVSQRIELYFDMGQTYEAALSDPDRAIEAYSDILSFDPDHTRALDALARLSEQIEAWDRAVDVLTRLTELVDDVSYRVQCHYRLGRIYGGQLNDAASAEECYQRALELDSGHAASMSQLVEVYKERGDWAKSAELMVRAETYTTNNLEKVRLLHEAGQTYLTHLDDEAKAAELFAQTLELDPDHVGAGEPLSVIYFREGRYEPLEPVLDMLVRKVDKRDTSRCKELYFQLATTADALGNAEKALKFFRAAYDIDSTDLPTLLGMADLLHRQEDWDRAFKIYQTLLVHHRDSQRKEDVVEIFYRLGHIKLKLGERKKALNMFEKALEIDPLHRVTLEAVIGLQTQQGDWRAVVQCKEALLSVAEPPEAFALQDELGDIFREHLNDLNHATASYARALELQPDSHAVLHKLLELHTQGKQWRKAVEVLNRLTEIAGSPDLRGKYLYAAAVIYRDELRAIDEALTAFDRALDEDSNLLKAFEAVDRLLTQKKDWKSLERSYRKMIKRLPAEGQDGLRMMLWHNLGEIYRTRLRDFSSAIAAFQVASALNPDDEQRHEILAELYLMSGPDYADKAVAEHQALIRRSPFRIESYRALRTIYSESGQHDKAWCVCAALAFLKKSDPEEQQLFEQYQQRGFVRAKARMTDELWQRCLYHPDEDPYIGAIFSCIGPVLAAQRARPHKQFGLRRKERRDLATDQLAFSKVFNYVTSVLNVVQAEVYLQPDRPTGLQMAHTVEVPSFVVGADMLQGRPEKELVFAVAKQLTYLRAEHFLRNVFPAPSQLKTVFLSALRMCNAQFPVPADELAEVEKIIKFVSGRAHPGQLEQLAMIVRKFAAGRGEANLNRWLSAVDLTANRVGFVLSNDLDVAARMVNSEPAALGALPAKERVQELLLYSISEEHFRVRAQLGIQVV